MVASPSTVALDLLQTGRLSTVCDPQGTVLDTALAPMTLGDDTPASLVARLQSLDPDAACRAALESAFAQIGAARPPALLPKL